MYVYTVSKYMEPSLFYTERYGSLRKYDNKIQKFTLCTSAALSMIMHVQLSMESISVLIGIHFNEIFNCCE